MTVTSIMGRASPRNGGIVKLMFRNRTLGLSLAALSAFLPLPLAAQSPPQAASPQPKRVLAWGDTLTAFQHDSISPRGMPRRASKGNTGEYKCKQRFA